MKSMLLVRSRTALPLCLLFTAAVVVAQPSLPDLKVDPKPGGSILLIHNTAQQQLTAYLIELVDYPGSSYALWQDEIITGDPVQPGGEKRIEITNMTVGAVPDYVKMRAAIYADGTTSGIPEKVAQIIARRKAQLEVARDLITRLESASEKKIAAPEVAASLQVWIDSTQPKGKVDHNSQAAINQAAKQTFVLRFKSQLGPQEPAEVLAHVRAVERQLELSRPAL
jgi:hypothetical protein